MTTYLPPRPGDANLPAPPPDVVISLFGCVGKHWSTAIVEDRRPVITQAEIRKTEDAINAAIFGDESHP